VDAGSSPYISSVACAGGACLAGSAAQVGPATSESFVAYVTVVGGANSGATTAVNNGLTSDYGGRGGPALGTNGTAYLAAWNVETASAAELEVQRFAADGTAIDATPIVAATWPYFFGPCTVTSNGTEYLVACISADPFHSVVVQLIGSDGRPILATPLELPSADPLDMPSLPFIGAASDGTDFLVVASTNEAWRIDATGTNPRRAASSRSWGAPPRPSSIPRRSWRASTRAARCSTREASPSPAALAS